MSARASHLVIDARPRGPRGLLAAEVVLDRCILDHLLGLASRLSPPDEPIVVHAREDETEQLRKLAHGPTSRRVTFVGGPPRADAAVLRTDRVYDERRLRRRLGQGKSPELAVLWRLDHPRAIEAAEDELRRRLTYQPIGKHWAFPLARALAQALCPTWVRPNHLTLTTLTLMLAAAGVIALGHPGLAAQAFGGLAMALALVLDTADGRLARLQGTSSPFGRWLDQVSDELADLALHAAIAWGAFARGGQPIWLAVGILYASGKYLFLIQSLTGNELESQPAERGSQAAAGPPPLSGPTALGWSAHAFRMMGHADIRWHLWIVLAFAGRLELALAMYALYFPARALAGSIRKGIQYA